jgi:transposase
MARPPARIQLSEEEESVLRGWTRKGSGEQRLADRARIVLLSHEGVTVEKIAEQLHTRPARISKWRQRFAEGRLNALSDAARPGKPHTYTEETEQRVLRLLDQPAPEGYAQWNGPLLAQALSDVSTDQVWRVLRKHQIQLQRPPRDHHPVCCTGRADRPGEDGPLSAAATPGVSGLHERSGGRPSGPPDARHLGQPEYPQTETGSLAEGSPQRPPALHSDLQLMAESGGMLVQHSQPHGSARGQFYLSPPTARRYRPVCESAQRKGRPV